MKIELFPGDAVLRRAQNGWIVAQLEELEEGVSVLTETVCEEKEKEDPEGVIGAIWTLFGECYAQHKRQAGFTCRWHETGYEAEEDAQSEF